MGYTFQQLREAVENATGTTIDKRSDSDGIFYQVFNPDGSIAGDTFTSLEDVEDYVCNCDEVQDYLLGLAVND